MNPLSLPIRPTRFYTCRDGVLVIALSAAATGDVLVQRTSADKLSFHVSSSTGAALIMAPGYDLVSDANVAVPPDPAPLADRLEEARLLAPPPALPLPVYPPAVSMPPPAPPMPPPAPMPVPLPANPASAPAPVGNRHAAAMHLFADDAARHVAPWQLWQQKEPSDGVWRVMVGMPSWHQFTDYRRTPRVVEIGGETYELPRALDTAPAEGNWVWAVRMDRVQNVQWRGYEDDLEALETGILFAKEGEAKQVWNAVRALLKAPL